MTRFAFGGGGKDVFKRSRTTSQIMAGGVVVWIIVLLFIIMYTYNGYKLISGCVGGTTKQVNVDNDVGIEILVNGIKVDDNLYYLEGVGMLTGTHLFVDGMPFKIVRNGSAGGSIFEPVGESFLPDAFTVKLTYLSSTRSDGETVDRQREDPQ